MTITLRDKIFVLVAAPLSVLALGFYFLHRPLSRQLASMRDRAMELGDCDSLRRQKRAYDRRLEESIRYLEAESKETREQSRSLGIDSLEPAQRLRRAHGVFSAENVRVVSTRRVLDDSESASAGILHGAGMRGAPQRWQVVFQGSYESFLSALESLSREKVPIVIESLSMRTDAAGTLPQWEVALCL